MRRTLLPVTIAFSLAAFSALAADPAAMDGGTTDATRGSVTQGAAPTDRAGHTMTYSTREPDTGHRLTWSDQQYDITGVVADRMRDSQVICKYAPVTGSRIGTELCMPLFRWRQMHEDAQQAIRDHEMTSHTGKQDLGFGTF